MPSDKDSVKCECPLGFKGDGFKKCEVVVDLSISMLLLTDINECKERKACQCPECSCKNTWGSYECSCSGFTSEISVGGRLAYNVIIGTCSRWGQYMDSEIRAIMAQYMPLDSQPKVPNHVNDEHA
ncbi:hypothetical protein IGI04_026749 [Brassica rapa subsp. trilocularis]|uniref:EGF-like domain-containing protein n=1 Tax=Brassica rapa subsp. trilocularis TaxID=1813537 RepID=A0ABQ7KWY5_BRACM|nr:hypothetical protein IGI04_026749 [Brassica rapa subsp. trilocularis]